MGPGPGLAGRGGPGRARPGPVRPLDGGWDWRFRPARPAKASARAEARPARRRQRAPPVPPRAERRRAAPPFRLRLRPSTKGRRRREQRCSGIAPPPPHHCAARPESLRRSESIIRSVDSQASSRAAPAAPVQTVPRCDRAGWARRARPIGPLLARTAVDRRHGARGACCRCLASARRRAADCHGAQAGLPAPPPVGESFWGAADPDSKEFRSCRLATPQLHNRWLSIQ